MAAIHAVTVFCGSSAGNRPEYAVAATALGETLAHRGITLVYGGASVGLMGRVADAALASGGRVVGVIPHALEAREIHHRGLHELVVVESMHARKRIMADRADGFIALPGGIGTLEELFEIWTWAQLGDHAKPCGMLDVCGYYDDLARFLDHTVREGFVRPVNREMLMVDTDAKRLLDRFAAHEPVAQPKWIGPSQS